MTQAVPVLNMFAKEKFVTNFGVAAVNQIDRHRGKARIYSRARVPLVIAILTAVICLQFYTSSRLPIWICYLFPGSRFLWDSAQNVHVDSGQNHGAGVWNYSSNVHMEITDYIDLFLHQHNSVWDVSCNYGFMLQRLIANRPQVKYYGSDVSQAMVDRTAQRCPAATTFPLDLHVFAKGPVARSHDDQPERSLAQLEQHATTEPQILPVADIIIVSDVLYYIGFGGWAPIFFQMGAVPYAWLERPFRLFADGLAAQARCFIVFSNHQNNPLALKFFKTVGAKIVMFLTPKGRNKVWILEGSARGRDDRCGWKSTESASRVRV